MSDTFDYISQYAKHLKETHTQRVNAQDDYEKDYLMEWDEENSVKSKLDDVKIVKSPDVRNRILGANRLLSATMPQFSIPQDMNTDEVYDQADALELAADKVFRAAGRVANNPIHYDVALSLNLWGEMHMGITRTADMVGAAEKRKENDQISKAELYRAEEIARLTPFTFDVWDPRNGYPDFDNMGLKAYYREVDVMTGDLIATFEGASEQIQKTDDRYKEVTLCQLWDWKYRYVWIRGNNEFLLEEEHGLPFIPVVVQLGEGSMLFEKPEDQRQPMGFTTNKTGLGSMQNLALTLAYTSLLKMGGNPQWVNQLNAQGEEAELDFSVMGGKWNVPDGGDLKPADLSKVVNPLLMDLYDIADSKVQESTIYSQALGEPMGKNAAFSMVALLHQAGRLPLLMPQKKAGWGIGSAVKKALVWLKEEPPKKAEYEHILGSLAPKDIPRHFELECKLDVSLPQDALQNANVAGLLVDKNIASRRYVQENILNEGKPAVMNREIWSERAADTMFEKFMLDQMAQLEMMREQVMQPEPPMQPQPGQVPPGAMPQGPPQQQGPGLQGLPPEMAQGGMQPPEGTLPPEQPPNPEEMTT
jgi:hypothetical protein